MQTRLFHKIWLILLLFSLLLQGCLPGKLDETIESTPYPTTTAGGSLGHDAFPLAYQMGRGLINDLAYSPDSSILAAATGTGLVLFNTSDMTEIGRPRPEASVRQCSWSADGSRMALAMTDQAIHILNTTTWDIEQSWNSISHINSMEWNYDGSILAMTDFLGRIILYDVAEEKVLYNEAKSTHEVIWAPDRSELFIMDYFDPFSTKILDAQTLQLSPTNLFSEHADDYLYAKWIATANGEFLFGTRYSLDTILTTTPVTNTDESRDITSIHFSSTANLFDVSPDAGTVALTSQSGDIHIYSMDTRRVEKDWAAHNGTIISMDWSPSGDWLATVGGDGVLKIWDTTSWVMEWSDNSFLPAMNNLAFIDPETMISTSYYSGDLYVLDLRQGIVSDIHHTDLYQADYLNVSPENDRFAVFGKKSSDEASLGYQRVLQVYSLDGDLLLEKDAASLTHSMCWGMDGDIYTIITPEITHWGINPDNIVPTTINFSENFPTARVMWNSDCSMAAAPGLEARLLTISNGDMRTLGAVTDEDTSTVAVAWSEKSDQLVFADEQGYLIVLDKDRTDIENTFSMEEEGYWVNRISFSPRGEFIAVASSADIFTLLNTSTGEQDISLRMPDSSVAFAWSENGSTLAASLSNGEILLFPVESDQ